MPLMPEALADCKIVCRNPKPGNLMFVNQGRLKLFVFGSAKELVRSAGSLEFVVKNAPQYFVQHMVPGSRGRRPGTRLLRRSRTQAAAGTFVRIAVFLGNA